MFFSIYNSAHNARPDFASSIREIHFFSSHTLIRFSRPGRRHNQGHNMNFKRQTFTQTLSNNRQNKILARILSIATIFNMIGTFPKNWLALRIPGCFFLHWPSAEKNCMIGWYFPWKKLALRILGQGLTSPRYPTRPELFFFLPEPDPNYFSKFPSLGFFPVSCFPANCFKSFDNGPQILLFSSLPDIILC